MSHPLLSICVPSYNRPRQLGELLASIDGPPDELEIVIAEDHAPERMAVRAIVAAYAAASGYATHYHENPVNLGYDGNLRRLIECAQGDYVLFMGDDDRFVPGALTEFIAFLKQHRDMPYVLRTYLTEHPNGRTEYFRYLPTTTLLSHGVATVSWLFKRSVTICGFTIARAEALKFATADLDGTLLYQVYLMAQVCLRQESIYCEIPVAHAVQSYREDKPMFGAAAAEQGRYTGGGVSLCNSINFTKAYFEVTKYLDNQHGTDLTQRVRVDLSKYSYPFLSIQRKRGIPDFLRYARRLEVEAGFGCTPFYYVYKWALVVLGEKVCDRAIVLIKRALGHTPNF